MAEKFLLEEEKKRSSPPKEIEKKIELAQKVGGNKYTEIIKVSFFKLPLPFSNFFQSIHFSWPLL